MNNIALLIIRIFIGFGMATHGYSKLMNYDQVITKFPDMIGIGVEPTVMLVIFAEFFCAILVMLGLLTRLASVPIIITMLVAFFVAHGADPFSDKELAFLYLGLYTSIFLMGPGQFSLGRFLSVRKFLLQ